jgi:hypothetical protein
MQSFILTVCAAIFRGPTAALSLKPTALFPLGFSELLNIAGFGCFANSAVIFLLDSSHRPHILFSANC